ncbi:hypothetical protein IWX90DRAFT_434175 [Phyllosticta citrichinensis]|uniref:Uncharacterized protein n=1 Tax=Phyllosticta citrichinensis TaxID=1130410 RepID=A0ABR1XUQ0_9PEZI
MFYFFLLPCVWYSFSFVTACLLFCWPFNRLCLFCLLLCSVLFSSHSIPRTACFLFLGFLSLSLSLSPLHPFPSLLFYRNQQIDFSPCPPSTPRNSLMYERCPSAKGSPWFSLHLPISSSCTAPALPAPPPLIIVRPFTPTPTPTRGRLTPPPPLVLSCLAHLPHTWYIYCTVH